MLVLVSSVAAGDVHHTRHQRLQSRSKATKNLFGITRSAFWHALHSVWVFISSYILELWNLCLFEDLPKNRTVAEASFNSQELWQQLKASTSSSQPNQNLRPSSGQTYFNCRGRWSSRWKPAFVGKRCSNSANLTVIHPEVSRNLQETSQFWKLIPRWTISCLVWFLSGRIQEEHWARRSIVKISSPGWWDSARLASPRPWSFDQRHCVTRKNFAKLSLSWRTSALHFESMSHLRAPWAADVHTVFLAQTRSIIRYCSFVFHAVRGPVSSRMEHSSLSSDSWGDARQAWQAGGFIEAGWPNCCGQEVEKMDAESAKLIAKQQVSMSSNWLHTFPNDSGQWRRMLMWCAIILGITAAAGTGCKLFAHICAFSGYCCAFMLPRMDFLQVALTTRHAQKYFLSCFRHRSVERRGRCTCSYLWLRKKIKSAAREDLASANSILAGGPVQQVDVQSWKVWLRSKGINIAENSYTSWQNGVGALWWGIQTHLPFLSSVERMNRNIANTVLRRHEIPRNREESLHIQLWFQGCSRARRLWSGSGPSAHKNIVRLFQYFESKTSICWARQ